MDVSELALRISLRDGRGDWILVAVQDFDPGETDLANLLEIELQATAALSADIVRDVPNGQALVDSAVSSRADVTIITNLGELTDVDWKAVDELRGLLSATKRVVVIVPSAVAPLLGRYAPNLLSWAGGTVIEVELNADTLTADERGKRLADLRSWSGKTDAQVVALAENGRLPKDPEFVEWLALLGRGDLIARIT